MIDAVRTYLADRIVTEDNMTNAMTKLTAAVLKGIVYYGPGCVWFNWMGMSPQASDAFVRMLLADMTAIESDGASAENCANHNDTPPNRARRARTA